MATSIIRSQNVTSFFFPFFFSLPRSSLMRTVFYSCQTSSHTVVPDRTTGSVEQRQPSGSGRTQETRRCRYAQSLTVTLETGASWVNFPNKVCGHTHTYSSRADMVNLDQFSSMCFFKPQCEARFLSWNWIICFDKITERKKKNNLLCFHWQ